MKPTNTNPLRNQAFTLVELLVVIVIIAVLGTLGFMGGRKMMDGAARAKTIGNIKQLVTAAQMFSVDHNGAVMDWTGTVVDGEKRNWSEHLLVTMAPDLATNRNYKNSAGDTMAQSLGIFSDSKAMKQAKGKLAKTGHRPLAKS
jgi:prepilin-type N-terminal cleavage/methylation domain-containing protein